MMAETAFAQQLRGWRERRRVSQLELATAAETSQRYLSFLEQGRSHPGRSMVVRLAEVLQLSLRERNDLLLAAGYAPIFPESALDAPELDAVRVALDTIIRGHLPYPAAVTRPFGVLVAANPAFALLTEGCAPQLLEPPINILRLALHPDGMAGRVPNLPEWGRHITGNLRNQAGHSPSPDLDALITELESYLPPTDRSQPHLGFAVPLRLRTGNDELRLITTATSFATATDITLSELQLKAYLPADQATSDYLRSHFAPA